MIAFLLAVTLLAQPYDVLIRNGRIVDGSGNAWFRGDVAISGDTIVAIGPRIEGEAKRTIDANGSVVAPGFIDLHTHARGGIFEVPTADNYILQGVTTIFEGPDGSSPLPIGEFLARVEKKGVAPNFATFVGHGSVREKVMGSVDRAATPAELEQMRTLVRDAMQDGAFGLSTGLFYVPGNFASTEEVIELAKVAGEFGGHHTSHMRDEAAKVTDSVRETIRIGEEGRLPTHVTHHKIAGARNWGRSADTLQLIDEARARGVDVTSDQYPYTASRTGLNALFPRWALEGGREQMLGRLRDPATRARIREAVIETIRYDRGGGDPKNVQISNAPHDASLAGKTLSDILRTRGTAPTVESGADLAMELLEKSDADAIFHMMNEEDVERILRHPATMIASDGEVPVFGKDAPHPRSYGTFARVLAVYVREKKVLSLEDAVRKMSSFPAARAGIYDRGLLRPGMKADVVVFDANRIIDKATFTQPHAYAEGVSHVLVNGVLVVDGGKVTKATPGKVLRMRSATESLPR
jgi:N-acyl-D-amino-acid deacylase